MHSPKHAMLLTGTLCLDRLNDPELRPEHWDLAQGLANGGLGPLLVAFQPAHDKQTSFLTDWTGSVGMCCEIMAFYILECATYATAVCSCIPAGVGTTKF